MASSYAGPPDRENTAGDDEALADRQAAAAMVRFGLRPRYALAGGDRGYAYLWYTGDGDEPHGSFLPYDWFSEMDTPILHCDDEAAVIAAAREGFARLPAARRRELAGF